MRSPHQLGAIDLATALRMSLALARAGPVMARPGTVPIRGGPKHLVGLKCRHFCCPQRVV